MLIFPESPPKKAAAAAAAANNHPVNGAANYSPATTPLGTSPTTGGNTFFTSFTSRGPNPNSSNVINSNCTTPCSQSCNTSSTKDVSALGVGPGSNSTPNFHHISSLPSTKIGSTEVRGGITGAGAASCAAASTESSPCESADEISCSISSNLAAAAASNTNNNVPYLTCCTSQERRERYKECKSMVQLPRGFDKLEWLAYHATFLVRFVGMFWLSNGLSQQCRCPTLSASHNVTWTMLDERTGKKITSKNSAAVDARALIENSLKNLEKILDNEELFPSKYGNQFNGDFENLVKRCCRSMYIMVSHVLHAHHLFLSEQKIDSSFIDLFAYLITFVREFSLMDRKDLPALEQVEFALSRFS